MTGNINMPQNEVLNLPDAPSRDHSAVNKKYVINNFCNTSGDTMTGVLNMGGHEITNIASNPTTDQSVVSKKYVEDNFLSSRGTMTDDLNMGGYEVIGLSGVPSFTNSAASKKYVDDEILAGLRGVSSGISQTQADARYVRKTKIALGERMDTFDCVNFVDYNWSKHVRKSIINVNSNIEIKVASFVTDMSISHLNKHKLVIGIAYVGKSTIKKHLVTIALSGKAFHRSAWGLPVRCIDITFTMSTTLGMTPTRKPLSYGRLARNSRPRKVTFFRTRLHTYLLL